MKSNIFYFLTIAAFLFSLQVGAQVAINTTGTAPVSSAMLDITSTSRGILIPRMSTAQRTAISSPAVGLLVYDITDGAFYYFDGGWIKLAAGGTSSVSVNAPLTTTGGSTPTISIPPADVSTDGYITSADWSLFNNKSEPIWIDNATYTYYSGFVGVGSSSAPPSKLYITNGTGNGYVTYIENTGGLSTSHGLKIQCSTNAAATTTNFIGFFDNDGSNLGNIRWNGTTGTGSSLQFVAISDFRLKQNITSTRFTIDTLMKINVVDFKWKDKPTGKTFTGFIAQDLYKVYPNAVIKPEDENTDYWSLNKEELLPLLVKSIQDQQVIIKSQEAKIKSLEDRLSALEAKFGK